MHESEKLREAEYFYSQLVDSAQRRGFTYNLRALLNSARSVLVYAYREIRNNSPGNSWYETAVQDPVIKFLRNVRHVDVHTRPIGTNQTVYPGASPPRETTHEFSGWSGPEDVPTLCRTYLDRLAGFIEDGQQKGYLTK